MKKLLLLTAMILLKSMTVEASTFLESVKCQGDLGKVEFINVDDTGGSAEISVSLDGAKENRKASYSHISSLVTQHTLTLQDPLLGVTEVAVVLDNMNIMRKGVLSGSYTDISGAKHPLACQKK